MILPALLRQSPSHDPPYTFVVEPSRKLNREHVFSGLARSAPVRNVPPHTSTFASTEGMPVARNAVTNSAHPPLPVPPLIGPSPPWKVPPRKTPLARLRATPRPPPPLPLPSPPVNVPSLISRSAAPPPIITGASPTPSPSTPPVKLPEQIAAELPPVTWTALTTGLVTTPPFAMSFDPSLTRRACEVLPTIVTVTPSVSTPVVPLVMRAPSVELTSISVPPLLYSTRCASTPPPPPQRKATKIHLPMTEICIRMMLVLLRMILEMVFIRFFFVSCNADCGIVGVLVLPLRCLLLVLLLLSLMMIL
mmetsp:Transcript_31568/g.68274  ORF Transcript_31568/g.68274 Transcript_31568/m.68274 type:complete len:306 (+) Transcript_31568:803-1720(+)